MKAFIVLILILLIPISSAYASIIISEVELNSSGRDDEWVELYNLTDEDISIDGWRLVTEDGESLLLSGIIHANDVIIIRNDKQWLDNRNTILKLYDENGIEVDKTILLSDNLDDQKTWQRVSITEWEFEDGNEGVSRLAKDSIVYTNKIESLAQLSSVIDGDTIEVYGIEGLFKDGKFTIRFADIDAPEIDTSEGKEAKEFLISILKDVDHLYVDVDDKYTYDRYGRVVAIVYIKDGNELVNMNRLLVDQGHARMIDYNNEFDPSKWKDREAIDKFDMHTIPEFPLMIPLVIIAASILLRVIKIRNRMVPW